MYKHSRFNLRGCLLYAGTSKDKFASTKLGKAINYALLHKQGETFGYTQLTGIASVLVAIYLGTNNSTNVKADKVNQI